MFTSLAEYRLLLRFDNADRRLAHYGYKIGLLPENIYNKVDFREKIINKTVLYAKTKHYSPKLINPIISKKGENPITHGTSLDKIIKRQAIKTNDILTLLPEDLKKDILKDPKIADQVDTDLKYEGYINRNLELLETVKKQEKIKIPKNIDYTSINSIKDEAREKLTLVQPETLGQAARIPGVSPADITALTIRLKKH